MKDPYCEPETEITDPDGASPPLEPGLYVVATPIGNLRDISLRAIDVLKRAAWVYAEDTRVSRKLLDAHGIKARLRAYHDHSPEAAHRSVAQALQRGEAVALISDAGTPLVSDPGYPLAREAIEAGHKIIPIPGPSAALAGLVASGLPTDRFFFAGFLPAREAARRAEIEALADIDATLVFFESANRTPETLRDLAATFGARQAAVARELTKMFEQTVRGQLDELAARYAREGPPKGEVVIVLGPPLPKPELSDDELDAYLGPRLAGGVKEAASAAARDLGVPRKRAYARALALGQRR